jgi:hypothetical protein
MKKLSALLFVSFVSICSYGQAKCDSIVGGFTDDCHEGDSIAWVDDNEETSSSELTSDRNWKAVKVKVAKCNGYGGSHCSCKLYRGYKRDGLDQYRGKCTNMVNEHQCGHGPKAHGLREY